MIVTPPSLTFPRKVISTDHLTHVTDVPGFIWRDPYLRMGSSDVGKVQAWFNGSSLLHDGHRFLVYRTECKRWFMFSRISFVQLDENFDPIPGTNRELPLHTRFDGWGAEDPKMFTFRGKPWFSYGDGYRILLAEMDDYGQVVRSGYCPSDDPIPNPPEKFPREKNWGFFDLGGRLYAQYSARPLVTVEVEPDKWTVVRRWESDWMFQWSYGMALHGGSPPVEHEGLLWRWIHSHRTEALPKPRPVWWSKDKAIGANRYYSTVMACEPKPPFHPVYIHPEPILWSPWPSETDEGPTNHSVTFVGSAEREENGWRLVYGENDSRIVTSHVPDEAFVPNLKRINPRSAPVRGTELPKNYIHFIWMQGVSQMPVEDQTRVEEWHKKNPDWVVKVWDRLSLTDFFGSHTSAAWRTVWEELASALDKDPTSVGLMAKMSDFARLVLLHVAHREGQSWNVYADTDTTPLRALTHFFEDDELYGENLPKAKSIQGKIGRRAWRADAFDLLVSQENLFYSKAHHVTNAVMIARPSSAIVARLIDAGARGRYLPTLEAWGPVFLEKALRNMKDTAFAKKFCILPFHYLVWNPHQMTHVYPPWSVSTHHNSFRWKPASGTPRQAGKFAPDRPRSRMLV